MSEGQQRRASDAPFIACLATIGGAYVLLILAMLVADASFTTMAGVTAVLSQWNRALASFSSIRFRVFA